ncbi:MAG: aminotransferase class V-fold PLP-dependent enzyme [Lachnospiraceae bacterium]|nr:aminotransferase class V-fold PLP-dependent enzyme [Lachnospiraceae bacterium]
MLSFVNDYCEVAHESILKKLTEISLDKNPGYGTDKYCAMAQEKIRKACNAPTADVYFLVGGTQTNKTVIDTCLKNYEGVVSANTGHINVHEAGAVEFTGHKVLGIPSHDGKICPKELEAYVSGFYKDGNHEHMIYPGMTYISQPTEYGTLYSLAELEEISRICKKYDMQLFVDGARLGYGLACQENDVTLPDLARLADVFYIGGTKVGAMFGEAVVFAGEKRPAHFITQVKQHGAMLAKGWLLGLQFDELFTDNLYEKIAKNAIDTAIVLKKALKEKGYTFLVESPTNQIIVVLDNKRMEELSKQVNFSFWEVISEEKTAIRFCTSWATKMSDVLALTEIL